MKDLILENIVMARPYQTFLESKYIALEKTIDENSKKNDDEKEISNSLDF